MDYVKQITVPKNTTKEIPLVKQIIIPFGIIKVVGYHFPLGCKGLAHLTIWDSSVQQWPRSQEFSYYGDDTLRTFPENYPLPNAYNILTFKCWNLDDTWPHTITTFITVLGEDEPSWFKTLIWSLTGGAGE